MAAVIDAQQHAKTEASHTPLPPSVGADFAPTVLLSVSSQHTKSETKENICTIPVLPTKLVKDRYDFFGEWDMYELSRCTS
jgi:hypothetical protein